MYLKTFPLLAHYKLVKTEVRLYFFSEKVTSICSVHWARVLQHFYFGVTYSLPQHTVKVRKPHRTYKNIELKEGHVHNTEQWNEMVGIFWQSYDYDYLFSTTHSRREPFCTMQLNCCNFLRGSIRSGADLLFSAIWTT